MNRTPSRNEIELYRSRYPKETRVQLDSDMDDPYPILAGTKGTILGIDDMGQALMKWDNGRGLALVIGHDSFHKLQLENCEKLIGHSDGEEKELHSVNEVAEFIAANGDTEIKTESNERFLKSKGAEITYISDKEYLEKLSEVLEPMLNEQENEELSIAQA